MTLYISSILAIAILGGKPNAETVQHLDRTYVIAGPKLKKLRWLVEQKEVTYNDKKLEGYIKDRRCSGLQIVDHPDSKKRRIYRLVEPEYEWAAVTVDDEKEFLKDFDSLCLCIRGKNKEGALLALVPPPDDVQQAELVATLQPALTGPAPVSGAQIGMYFSAPEYGTSAAFGEFRSAYVWDEAKVVKDYLTTGMGIDKPPPSVFYLAGSDKLRLPPSASKLGQTVELDQFSIRPVRLWIGDYEYLVSACEGDVAAVRIPKVRIIYNDFQFFKKELASADAKNSIVKAVKKTETLPKTVPKEEQ